MIITILLAAAAALLWLLSLGAAMTFEEKGEDSAGYCMLAFGLFALLFAFAAGTHL